MSTNDELLVRLKPHDARRGHVLRCYCYAGLKFHDRHGWYRVCAEIGRYLSGVRQASHDPSSPLAFDVCTETDAVALDAKEAEASARRTPAQAIPAESRPRPAAPPATPDARRAGERGERRERREDAARADETKKER